MTFRKFLLAFLIICVPLAVIADDDTDELRGAGSKDNPYVIESLFDLINFRQRLLSGNYRDKYKDKYFVLTNDIHINKNVLDADGNLVNDGHGLDNFTPIGEDSYYKYFQAHFDGQGHTIYGLYIDTDEKDAGFFGYMYDGSISNLNFKDCYVKGSEAAGIVLGRCRGGKVSNCKVEGKVEISGFTYQAGLVVGNGKEVEDCTAEGSIEAISIPDEYGFLHNCIVGGVCGSVQRLNNCTNLAEVKASGWCSIGGLAGTGSTVSGSINLGTVSCDAAVGIGGIVGSSSSVWNSENHGNIIAKAKGARIGGICGNASGNTTISGCVNYTDFTVDTDSIGVGGIVAYPEADRYTCVKIISCINHGNIEVAGVNSYGGGISGKAYAASFFDCTNYGNITVPSNDAAGICSYGTYHSNVYGCTNYGDIITSRKGAGIIAHSSDGAVGCFNFGQIEGLEEDAILGGIVGRCESSSCFVKYSANLGNISNGDFMGGIVGSATWGGGMYSCYNSGDLNATRPRAWIGGLAGYAGFSIYDCYNVGNVVASGEGTLIGGLAGKVFCGSTQWSILRNCFNMGYVCSTGKDSFAGSLLGKNDTYGSYDDHLRNCFFLENTLCGIDYTDLLPESYLPENYAKECGLADFKSLNESLNINDSYGHWAQGLYHPVLERYDQYSDERNPQPMAWKVATATNDSVLIDLGRAFANTILVCDTDSPVCYAPNVLNSSNLSMRLLSLYDDYNFELPEHISGFKATEAYYCRHDTSKVQTIVLPFDANIPTGTTAWRIKSYDKGVFYCEAVNCIQAGISHVIFDKDTPSEVSLVCPSRTYTHLEYTHSAQPEVSVVYEIIPSDYISASYTEVDFEECFKYYAIADDSMFHCIESDGVLCPFTPLAKLPYENQYENLSLSLDFYNSIDENNDKFKNDPVDVFNLNGFRIFSNINPENLSTLLKPGLYILSNGQRIAILN